MVVFDIFRILETLSWWAVYWVVTYSFRELQADLRVVSDKQCFALDFRDHILKDRGCDGELRIEYQYSALKKDSQDLPHRRLQYLFRLCIVSH